VESNDFDNAVRQGYGSLDYEVVDKRLHDMTRTTTVYRLCLFPYTDDSADQGDARKHEKKKK
jgi:hypothetical protein